MKSRLPLVIVFYLDLPHFVHTLVHTLEAMVGSAPTSAGSKSAVLLLNDTATLKAPSKGEEEGAFRTHDSE